ncbi:hypothetical protein BEH_07810 [Priestia filamentosa]|uniref:Uncharacterized protein n=1 Tax=Priestia filamentosa TaxID=1402861 RepID=A0A0H4KEH6_9BACI|nr:hypothetical protein [Priestia filamentosa]AKO92015.1 hypothetical protein BEH_07810 [Priestia filamentosa]
MNYDNLIIGKRCEVYADFLVKVRKRRMTKQGTIRGFYVNEHWHPYTYRAFHIEFDDGTKDTFKAQDVKITG